MLSSKLRLKTEDFKQLNKFKKKVFTSSSFTLKVYYSGVTHSRFAVVIPKTFSKKATERNKLKRRIKAVLVEFLSSFKEGLSVVVYPKKEIKEFSFEDIKKDLIILFKKSNILK